MEDIILESPTVGDLIKKLQEYPPKTLFRIKDADTSWIFDIMKLSIRENILTISVEYGDQL